MLVKQNQLNKKPINQLKKILKKINNGLYNF